MEVASVGRSLANEISRELRLKYRDEPGVTKLRQWVRLCRPPVLPMTWKSSFRTFGREGHLDIFQRRAGAEIRNELTEAQWADLINFEGNANSFRLLTHQFKGGARAAFA